MLASPARRNQGAVHLIKMHNNLPENNLKSKNFKPAKSLLTRNG